MNTSNSLKSAVLSGLTIEPKTSQVRQWQSVKLTGNYLKTNSGVCLETVTGMYINLSKFSGHVVTSSSVSTFSNGQKISQSVQTPQSAPVQTPQSAPVQTPQSAQTRKSGNGHKKEMIRTLTDSERDLILNWFVNLNGMVIDKDVSGLHATMHPDLAVWQITGFVSYLHAVIAGKAKRREPIILPNLSTYRAFRLVKKHAQ
jgi:hypothetical protein